MTETVQSKKKWSFFFKPRMFDMAILSIALPVFLILACCFCCRLTSQYIDLSEWPDFIAGWFDGFSLLTMSQLLLCAAAGCIAPLPFIVASKHRTVGMRVFAFASCVFLIFFFCYTTRENRLWDVDIEPYSYYGDESGSALRIASWRVVGTIASICAIFALLTFFIEFAIARYKKNRPEAKWKRVHTMIAAFLLLAFLVISSDLYLRKVDWLGWLSLALVFGFLPGIVVNFLNSRMQVVAFFIPYCIFFTTCFGLYVGDRFGGDESAVPITAMIFYSLPYLAVSVLLFRKKQLRDEPASEPIGALNRSRKFYLKHFSLWSPMILILVTAFAAIELRYDLFTLVTSVTDETRFDLARKVKIFHRSFGRESDLVVTDNDWYQQQVVARVDLKSKRDIRAIKLLKDWQMDDATFKNFSSAVEPIRLRTTGLSIEGEVTHEQLAEFLKSDELGVLHLDAEVTGSQVKSPPKFHGYFTFKLNKSGDFAKVKNYLGQIGYLNISGPAPLSLDDWRAIENLPASCMIMLNSNVLQPLSDLASTESSGPSETPIPAHPMKNLEITVEVSGNQKIECSDFFWALVLDGDAAVSVKYAPGPMANSETFFVNSELIWDIFFGLRNSSANEFLSFMRKEMAEQIAKVKGAKFFGENSHLLFVSETKNKKASCYFPGTVTKDSLLEVLGNCGLAEAVSFDERWIAAVNYYDYDEVDSPKLGGKELKERLAKVRCAKSLKELYFPTDFCPTDLSCLAVFENLETLQISSRRLEKIGTLKNLKKLILYSPPPSACLKQLRSFPNLQEIEVYYYGYTPSQYERNLMRLTLPKVRFSFSDEVGQYRPRKPDYMLEHFDAIRKRIREKRLKK